MFTGRSSAPVDGCTGAGVAVPSQFQSRTGVLLATLIQLASL